jgi:hypothetical protein
MRKGGRPSVGARSHYKNKKGSVKSGQISKFKLYLYLVSAGEAQIT